MITLMLSTSHEHEERILQAAFQQLRVSVIVFRPSYQQYVKMLQYLPDLIILEFPTRYSDQLHFIKLIRTHKKLMKIPIIGYGGNLDFQILNGILQHGTTAYYTRPLKFSALIIEVEKNLKKNHKSLQIQQEKSDRHKDEDLLLKPDVLPMQKLEILRKYIAGIMAFPFTVTKVLRVSEDESAGAKELAKVIEADPSISTHILKVSNSVFFASSNRRINSIKDAIVRIGFRETKRITLTMSVMDMFDKKYVTAGFDKIDFWYHSLSTAIISEQIARRMRGVNHEEAFLAGLLHDFGIILLETHFSDIFSKILEATTNKGIKFVAAEMEMMGITHCDLIKDLFELWKIPADLTTAISDHYNFRGTAASLSSNADKLTVCTGLANVIAKSLYLGKSCDQFVEPVDNVIFSAIKIPEGISGAFIKVVNNEIDLYRKFLGLDTREFPYSIDGIADAQNYSICILDLQKSTFIPSEQYLRKEGFKVDVVRDKIDFSKLDQKYHLILVMPDQVNDTLDLTSLTSLKHKDEDGNETPVSLLIMYNETPIGPLPDFVSLLSQKIDLRRLDQALATIIIDGKVVGENFKKDIR